MQPTTGKQQLTWLVSGIMEEYFLLIYGRDKDKHERNEPQPSTTSIELQPSQR